VYGKLQVHDRVDAAIYADRHGLRVSDGDGDAGRSSPVRVSPEAHRC
jgi:hypothetical protein